MGDAREVKTFLPRDVCGRLLKGSASGRAQPIKPEYIGQSSNVLVPDGKAAWRVALREPRNASETEDG